MRAFPLVVLPLLLFSFHVLLLSSFREKALCSRSLVLGGKRRAALKKGLLSHSNGFEFLNLMGDALEFQNDAEAVSKAEKLAWDAIHEPTDQIIQWRLAYSLAAVAGARIFLDSNRINDSSILQHRMVLRRLDVALMIGHPTMYSRIHRLILEIKNFLPEVDFPLISTSSFENQSSISSPYALKVPVEREPPSQSHFYKHVFNKQPVLIQRAMQDWPALKPGSVQSWSGFQRILKIAGHRTVPVEVGRHYMCTNWTLKLMPLQEYFRRHVLNGSTTNTAAKGGVTGYVAQHELFKQVPELCSDVRIPEYCAVEPRNNDGEEVQVNVWLGPSGTTTPLHYDRYHNFLCQVLGEKKITMFAPNSSSYLHPCKPPLNNTSQVDPYSPGRYSDVLKQPHWEVTLHPGEMLYIPPGWWHHVQSKSASASVNFWWL